MRLCVSVIISTTVAYVLIAISTRYVSPFWVFSVFYGLQLHASAACMALLTIALMFWRHKIIWIMLGISGVFLVHAWSMTSEFSTQSDNSKPEIGTFRLLSFNIGNYNKSNIERFVSEIAVRDAEVVVIMEARPLHPWMEKISKIYPYRIGCGILMKFCDQLMLSKYPIDSPVVRDLTELFSQRFIMGAVSINGQSITVVGMHTTKPYFDDFQTDELQKAAGAISKVNGPVVVAGDFNTTSLAVNMRAFLRSANLNTSSWEPATWPIQAGRFGVPIDHIYTRVPLQIKRISSLPESFGSNHFGLLAEIALTP